MPTSGLRGYVLVGGWPAAGKTTLATALAARLRLPCLAKDEIKQALMDALGAPPTVAASRTLGVAAVHATLQAARGCPAAVVDSTWYPYSVPLVRALTGPFVEIRCRVPVELARERYRRRARDDRHLDALRTDDELWGREVAPLGVGPLVDVDTTGPVDLDALAATVRAALADRRAPGAGHTLGT
ncbi:hypothetical protein Sya03_54700 [Spirilliplanes yamanashiensis]|uniref:Kinase n=1 Tax=Spirilliplanes yamanashiensis TaxID=42233 RepID=A0A8J4DM72_9ACTN|nr:hypothetical protein Sya03_54700 [Spirilliplanes yamanashiensis]